MTTEATPPTESEKIGGIDPALLQESGRASAAQDLADRAVAVEKTLLRAEAKQKRRDDIRNALIGLGVFIILVSQGIQQYRAIYVTGPRSERTEDTANDIAEAFAGVQTLVEFVEGVEENQANQAAGNQELFRTIFGIAEVLCQAQNQPAIVERCAELNIGQPATGEEP